MSIEGPRFTLNLETCPVFCTLSAPFPSPLEGEGTPYVLRKGWPPRLGLDQVSHSPGPPWKVASVHHHPTLLDRLLKDEKVLAVYLSGIQEWGPCPCPGHASIRLGCERSGTLGPLGQYCGGLHSTKRGRRSCSRSWL